MGDRLQHQYKGSCQWAILAKWPLTASVLNFCKLRRKLSAEIRTCFGFNFLFTTCCLKNNLRCCSSQTVSDWMMHFIQHIYLCRTAQIIFALWKPWSRQRTTTIGTPELMNSKLPLNNIQLRSERHKGQQRAATLGSLGNVPRGNLESPQAGRSYLAKLLSLSLDN